MGTMTPDPIDSKSCVRCGTCCRKGGPALHKPDAGLYREGFVRKDHLLTLRKGERVLDNVRGEVVVLREEIVRMRSLPGTAVCVHFDAAVNGCAMYAHRPQECRVLECWNPRELAGMYDRDRLLRLDLISRASALGELIVDHEQRCGYDRVQELLPAARRHEDVALNELGRMIGIDQGIRRSLGERAQASDEELNFLFGRPLAQTLRAFGVSMEMRPDGIAVSVRPEPHPPR